jgi:DNA-3-methyladenine glycosylase
LEGIERMKINRFGKKKLSGKELYQLTNGPGKVCKAFGITKNHLGVDLTDDRIYLENSILKKNEEIAVSKRIGISKSADLPWRFFIKNNPYLSRK